MQRQCHTHRPPARGRYRRGTAVAAVAFLPVVATILYLALGSPQLPGQPLEERQTAAHQDRSVTSLLSQVEAYLERNPDDARGYEVLAPVYMRLGRFSDAVNARRKLLTLSGENAERQSDLGEALAAIGNGIVTAEAKAAFDRALVLDPNELKARFYMAWPPNRMAIVPKPRLPGAPCSKMHLRKRRGRRWSVRR